MNIASTACWSVDQLIAAYVEVPFSAILPGNHCLLFWGFKVITYFNFSMCAKFHDLFLQFNSIKIERSALNSSKKKLESFNLNTFFFL